MKSRWGVVVALEPETFHDSFAKAFAHLYKEVQRKIEEGLSLIALEQGTWIKLDDPAAFPLLFYSARDEAHKQGILTEDGKLVEAVISRL